MYTLAKFAAGSILADLIVAKGAGLLLPALGKGAFRSGLDLGASLARSLFGASSAGAASPKNRHPEAPRVPGSCSRPAPAATAADLLEKHIVSSVPGRVRIRHTALRFGRDLEDLRKKCEAEGAHVTFNTAAGSALVRYSPARTERARALAPLAEYLAHTRRP